MRTTPHPPLVARERELRLLARAVAQPPAVVLIEGEAGVSKTRLVHEVRVGPDRVGPLVGHCHPQPFPFGPVVEALRAAPLPRRLSPVCGVLRPLLPELADQLPTRPDPGPADPAARRHLLFRAFAELLGALGPAVVVLEDVQHVDPDTRALLDFLAPRLPEALTLVLTYRGEELPDTYPVAALPARLPHGALHSEVRLPPLTPQEVHTLARALLDTDHLTPAFTERLHQHSGGVPFAAVELLRHLRACGADTTDPACLDTHPTPAPLRDAVLERLLDLPRPARHLVRAAAVLAEPALEQVLADVAALTPTAATRGLARAQARGVLTTTPDGRVAFRHPLTRRVCHDALPLDRRRLLHRRAAAALRDQPAPPYDRLAAHCREAGLHEDWTAYAEKAADRASAAGDDTTAAALLRDALSRPALAPPVRGRLAVKLGKAALTGMVAEETLALLRDIIDQDGLSPGTRGELRLELALLLLNKFGQGELARQELIRAAAELSRRPALAARAMSALAVPRATPDPVNAHRRWARRAATTAERSGDTVVRLAVQVNHATLLAQLGDPDAWRIDLGNPDGPTDRAHRRELARGALNLADAAVMLGHYPRAERYLRRSVELAHDTDSPVTLVGAESTRLLLDWATGTWAGLAERADTAATSARQADLTLIAAEVDLVRAQLALAHGEPATAERLLADVRHTAAVQNIVPLRAATAGTLARILLARGQPRAAWEAVEAVLRLIQVKGIWVWAADLTPAVEALLACGHADHAARLADRFEAGIRGARAPAARAALARWRAHLARHDGAPARAAELCARAEAGYRDLPRPYEAAQAREARGLVAGGGDVADLHQALQGYVALGAAWDAARCRRALRAQGVAAHAGGHRGYGTDLSPREREVVRLAAAGHTNREIAATLYLSPRTVETHVANALGKLGLRSRRHLATHPAVGTP